MISVEFRGVGAGRCVWCDKDKDEVFDVVFSDKSFVGMYCRADLLKAVTVKCKKATVTAQPAQALPVNGPVEVKK